MTTTFKTITELVEDKSQYCPIPLSLFPDLMGINLNSVQSISWQKQDDGQLTNISIHFIPDNTPKRKESPLDRPANYNLIDIFEALKAGRPAQSQRYLQNLIDELKQEQ